MRRINAGMVRIAVTRTSVRQSPERYAITAKSTIFGDHVITMLIHMRCFFGRFSMKNTCVTLQYTHRDGWVADKERVI